MKRLLSFSRLEKFKNRRAAHLSGGMKQKLALCCALIHKPQLLLLDEPTTGVDPVSRKEFSEILFDLKKQGITILVSTPYMDEADMCDELMIIHKGSVLRNGSPDSLKKSLPYRVYQVQNRQQTVHCRAWFYKGMVSGWFIHQQVLYMFWLILSKSLTRKYVPLLTHLFPV
jgi:ABC-type multidrug transport system ATPase subunit